MSFIYIAYKTISLKECNKYDLTLTNDVSRMKLIPNDFEGVLRIYNWLSIKYNENN